MKFNPDCVRDILFVVEEKTGYNKEITYSCPEQFPLLSKYSNDEIMYHLHQCKSSGLIDCFENIFGKFKINDLTNSGHSLIAKIREDKTWKKVLTNTVSSVPTLITMANEICSAISNI